MNATAAGAIAAGGVVVVVLALVWIALRLRATATKAKTLRGVERIDRERTREAAAIARRPVSPGGRGVAARMRERRRKRLQDADRLRAAAGDSGAD